MYFKTTFFVRPLKIFSAANSGVFIKGIGKSLVSVIGVLINPGDIKDIDTLYF